MLFFQDKESYSGFAILDATIAAAVFAIGILAVNYLYMSTIKTNKDAFIMTDTVETASGYIDSIQAAPYSAIPVQSTLQGIHTYTVSSLITECTSPSTCVDKTKTVNITVTKPDGVSYTFRTVKADLEGLP